MSFSYKDLVFESNKTDNYMMDLCMLPEGVNLRCNDFCKHYKSTRESKMFAANNVLAIIFQSTLF